MLRQLPDVASAQGAGALVITLLVIITLIVLTHTPREKL